MLIVFYTLHKGDLNNDIVFIYRFSMTMVALIVGSILISLNKKQV